MTQLKPYQACRKNDGWIPVEVMSESNPGVDYTVMVSPWGGPQDNICECKGYIFRGVCKHQVLAMRKICRWNALEGPEEQSAAQEQNKICPRCAGPTKYELEVVEDAN